MKPVLDLVPESADQSPVDSVSIADLFLNASRELAKSDARLYRSLDLHIRNTREVLAREDLPAEALAQRQSPHRLLTGACSYERQTRRSLQQLCKDNDIKGYSRMTKSVMIERLLAKGIDAPRIPLEALSKAELIDALRHMMAQERHA